MAGWLAHLEPEAIGVPVPKFLSTSERRLLGILRSKGAGVVQERALDLFGRLLDAVAVAVAEEAVRLAREAGRVKVLERDVAEAVRLLGLERFLEAEER